MSFSGLDVEEARAFARQLADSTATLDYLSAGINTALYSTPWEGPDANAFREQWEVRHKRAFTAATSHLRDATEQLLKEVDEQEKASAGANAFAVGPDIAAVVGALPIAAAAATGVVPPDSASPRDVARWWASLSNEQRTAYARDHPETVGSLDGLPSWVRNEANRELLNLERARLEREARRLEESLARSRFGGMFSHADENLADVRARLAALEVLSHTLTGDRQLLVFDAGGDRLKVAVAVGDVDSADHVAVFTPGLNTTITKSLAGYDLDMQHLKETAERELARAHRSDTVAAISWLGYDTPQLHPSQLTNPLFLDDFARDALNPDQSVASDNSARDGGKSLSAFFDGLKASRPTGPHLTALGHSYGSTTTGLALQQTDSVDDVVFFGSPGIGTSDAGQLHVPSGHAFAIEARRDAVADLGRFGPDPNHISGLGNLSARDAVLVENGHEDHLGESIGHSEYLKEKTTSEYNMGLIVGGMPERVIDSDSSGAGDALREGAGDALKRALLNVPDSPPLPRLPIDIRRFTR